MPRYASPYTPQTPIGQGLQSIAAAMAARPSPEEEQITAEELTAAQLANEATRRQQAGGQSISDVIAQLQMAGEQTADFIPAGEDPGVATLTRGLPIAAAKYAAPGGGLTPEMSRTIYGAMSQYAPEEQLRRALPTIGQIPGLDTALTVPRAEEIRETKGQQSIAEALAKIKAKPAKPLKVTPADTKTMMNFFYGSIPASYETPEGIEQPLALSPADERIISSKMAQYFRDPTSPAFGNHAAASQLAAQELGEVAYDPGKPEESSIFNPFSWGTDYVAPTVALQPPARAGTGGTAPTGGAMTDLPPAAQHPGRVVRDTKTGARYRSVNGQWVPEA